MAAFIPPLFKNFGKSAEDLLKKKFEFNQEVKVKTSTQSGVTFESTGRRVAKSDAKSDYVGLVKATYKRSDFGTFETELDTTGKANVSAENDQLRKGLVVKTTANQAPDLGLDIGYRQEHFSGGVVATVATDRTVVEGSAAIGYDGLSVGAQGAYNVTKQAVHDYNAGVEYTQPDHTVTVKTTSNKAADPSNIADKLNFAYIHNLSAEVSVGGLYSYPVGGGNSELTAVGSYALDRDTTVKGKFNSKGDLTSALEQRLYNPKLKYGLAAQYSLPKSNLDKVGVSVTFGDN